MNRLGNLYIAFLCLVLTGCSPKTEAGIDLDRLIDCIGMVEGNPWTRPGGLYGFTKATWRDFSSLPYGWAQNPTQARKTARKALLGAIQRMQAEGLTPSPYLLAVRWRWGYEGMRGRLNRQDDYGQRVTNLYFDTIL